MEGLNEALDNTIEAAKDSRWIAKLRKDAHFSEFIKMVENKDDGLIRLRGGKRLLRTADFSRDEGELKMYLEDGRAVFVVPKDYRYEVFHESHSGLYAGHFKAHKLTN